MKNTIKRAGFVMTLLLLIGQFTSCKKTVRKVKRVQKLVEKGKMKKATRVAARYDRKRKKKGNK